MSLPSSLHDKTLAGIVERFGLDEVEGPEGPHLTLHSAMSPAPVGSMRVFTGSALQKVVTISLAVEPIGLDSHMIFAFTPVASLVPHFTLDAVKSQAPTGDGVFYAFHLDLIPRADLAANLAYLDHCFAPLTPAFEETSGAEGLSKAHISPRQHALMSPWMLVARADETAFARIEGPVGAYLEHWSGLVETGVPESVSSGIFGGDVAERDRRNRSSIFDPEVDPVWANVERLVGPDVTEHLRAQLIEPSVVIAP